MGFFRQLHKSAFWSQLLLGVVAILALPIPQPSNETEPNLVQQTLTLNEFVVYPQFDSESAHFLLQDDFSFPSLVKQAVVFCQFLTKCYRLEMTTNPPIRAGPII